MTKNTLSKKDIKDSLLSLCKADIFHNICFFVSLSAVCLPISALCIYTLLYEPISANLITKLARLFMLFSSVFFIMPSIYFIFKIIQNLRFLYFTKKEYFSVVNDIVVKAVKDDHAPFQRFVRTLYFYKFGKFITPKTIFDYTSLNDNFYVVIYNIKNPKPILIYSTKYYEYIE